MASICPAPCSTNFGNSRTLTPSGVTLGDFATTTVDRTFRLVYLIRNTITNLTTQDEQVNCFRNAAAHLQPGGLFVIENYIPALQQLPPLLDHRRRTQDLLIAAPVPLARRTRPHGPARGNDLARTLERLAPHAVHQPEP
jgi:hypothetical protein